MIDRAQPDRFNDIFKSKDTSEQESKYGGKDTGTAHNRCKVNFLKAIQKESSDSQKQSLTDISEHCAEDESVCQRYKDRRIDFIVGRKSIHPDKHLKRLKDFRVFQLCRRFIDSSGVFILHNAVDIVIIFNIFLESSGILL